MRCSFYLNNQLYKEMVMTDKRDEWKIYIPSSMSLKVAKHEIDVVNVGKGILTFSRDNNCPNLNRFNCIDVNYDVFYYDDEPVILRMKPLIESETNNEV